MNRSSKPNPGRFAVTAIAAAACWALASPALGLGLGRMQVQSALGEALRAEIEVTSLTPEEASNLRVRVASPDAYKTAGVDYNVVLPGTRVDLLRRADGRPYLRLSSDRGVQEPFVDVILEMNWASGRLVREYTMLFDPPATARTPATPPVLAAATPPPASTMERRLVAVPMPAPAPAVVAQAPVPAAVASRPARVDAAAGPAAPVAPAGSRSNGNGADAYKVRSGDSLSRIATKTQRSGVSLDQMLVSLYRANPQAFIGNNMNRLRSGVVLSVPNADTVRSVGQEEAHQVIQAQSADFGAYRQRLAGIVPPTRSEGSARQATGRVQAQVDERQAGAPATPDRLTLSTGRAASAGPGAMQPIRPIPAAPPAPTIAAAPPVPAPAPVPAPPPPPPPPPPPAPPPPPPPPPPAPAETPTALAAGPSSAPGPANAVTPPASQPDATAAVPAPVVVPASSPAAPASRPAPAASATDESGPFGALLEENPVALGIGGLALAALVAFGLWRFARRSRTDSSETSFLESRLQPDSFFGASGGQRIDTRDGGGTSSSMSYSLSQLDAIGDVDPVAEADVYLAYGRDLQAEEILKEAMRSNPDRMAIRTKLLEVYAKRRDVKGFELLATQLFALTRGEGEDWRRAQELGLQIDPENPLYRPGGMPPGATVGPAGQMVEPLGASTMPQSVLPSPSQFDAARESRPGGLDLDLDLDLDAPPAEPAGGGAAVDRFAPTELKPQASAFDVDPMSIDFSTTESPASGAAPQRPAAARPPRDDELTLNLDLPGDTVSPADAAASGAAAFDEGGLSFTEDADDPMSRKLELADEFRQIGDHEGARDLLREVVAKSSGSMKTRAQSMLADLE